MERRAKIVRNFERYEYLQKSSLDKYGIFCEIAVSVSRARKSERSQSVGNQDKIVRRPINILNSR